MKVVMDTSCLQRTGAGAAMMVRGLFEGFARLETPPQIQQVQPAVNLRKYGRIAEKADTLFNDMVWWKFMLPGRLSRSGADLFHVPYLQLPPRIPMPWVVSILDFHMKRCPEHFSPWSVKRYLATEHRLREADGVLCISEFTRQELLHFHPEVDPAKVKSVHLGVRAFFQPQPPEVVREVLQRLGVERPYFMIVGTMEPRKNIVGVLEAFIREFKADEADFVVVGGDGWIPDYVQNVNRLVEAVPNIHRTGYASDADVRALYSGALAYCFPSMYEGFGLPVLEAMRCGCPVLASQGSSLDEVCGTAATQLPPDKPEAWAVAMREVYGDQGKREQMAAEGMRWAGEFTWERTAKNTLDVYRGVLQGEAP